eukprot:Clim_evm3s53 gene=Clim_evmTU3s53
MLATKGSARQQILNCWELEVVVKTFFGLTMLGLMPGADAAVATLWEHLRSSAWYQWAQFETILNATLVILTYPAFRSDMGRLTTKKEAVKKFARLFCTTQLPFLILDVCTPKPYAYVPVEKYLQREGFIHFWRLLPEQAPTAFALCWETMLSLVVFDFIFYFVHTWFHTREVYPMLHKEHHSVTHGLDMGDTFRLHPLDLVLTVLAADMGAKICGAHPLARNLIAILFVPSLVISHAAEDLRTPLEIVYPRYMALGRREHRAHHLLSPACNYGEFCSLPDRIFGTYRDGSQAYVRGHVKGADNRADSAVAT